MLPVRHNGPIRKFENFRCAALPSFFESPCYYLSRGSRVGKSPIPFMTQMCVVSEAMRVFLRHFRTGHYYIGNSEWVVQQSDARDFRNIEQALEAIANDKLDGMAVVLRHAEGGPEQVLDLEQRCPLAGSGKAQGRPLTID